MSDTAVPRSPDDFSQDGDQKITRTMAADSSRSAYLSSIAFLAGIGFTILAAVGGSLEMSQEQRIIEGQSQEIRLEREQMQLVMSKAEHEFVSAPATLTTDTQHESAREPPNVLEAMARYCVGVPKVPTREKHSPLFCPAIGEVCDEPSRTSCIQHHGEHYWF